PATRGADGAGAGVLDGLFGRLTRFPPRTRCTRSPGLAMETGDELGMLLDRGRRSAEIFRHDRPWSPAGVPQATGARWCDPAIDRQMAQRGGAGGWGSYDQPFQHATSCIIMGAGNGLRLSTSPRQGCINHYVLARVLAPTPMPTPTLAAPRISTDSRHSSLSDASN